MALGVIIVTYNSAATIKACLESLLAARATNITVVDNQSSDQTVAICRTFSQVQVLPQDQNLGYNGGNQIGIDHCRADILVLLNPDTVVPANFTTAARALVKAHPQAGLIGCGIKNQAGAVELTSSRLPSFMALVYQYSRYQSFFPHSRAYHNYLMLDWDRTTPRRVEAVSGACTIMTKRFAEQVTPLDQRYFLYFEELDLGQRAKRLGVEVIYDPTVYITHIGAASAKQIQSHRRDKIFGQSRDYYVRKYYGTVGLVAFRLVCRWFDLAWRLGGRFLIKVE